LRIFDSGINDRPYNGKGLRTISRSEQPGDFLFDLEGSYRSFGSVIIRGDVLLVEEAEQMLPVLGHPVFEGNQLFLFGIERLLQ
jgi:hypothetical protein